MKRQRQAAILKAVGGPGGVASQQELVELLARQGFRVSQTTVSRDLRELGLAKGRDSGGSARYSEPSSLAEKPEAGEALRRSARQALLSVESTSNLVVVKTTPGSAQGLAWALDSASIDGIAGTVAGDDTIIVVCSAGVSSKKIGEMLMEYALDKR
jgi:transcriptional regulator of arginine metabolism